MNIGWPADFAWYKLLTDWGSLIGGGIGALVGGALAAYAAYVSVKTTLEGQAKGDDQKLSKEIAGIRRALHTEVGMIGVQCLRECEDWLSSISPRMAPKSTRTAKMPPLTIYNSVSPRIGLLTREEIVPLISLSRTIHDAQMVVQSIDNRGNHPNDDDKGLLALLFSNACMYAANFMSSVKDIPPCELDSTFINKLREAQKSMEHARIYKRPSA